MDLRVQRIADPQGAPKLRSGAKWSALLEYDRKEGIKMEIAKK